MRPLDKTTQDAAAPVPVSMIVAAVVRPDLELLAKLRKLVAFCAAGLAAPAVSERKRRKG